MKSSILSVLVFVVSLGILSVNLNSVGEHWDEVTVASVGESYLGFMKNGDFSPSSWELNHEHPPVAKYIYGVARFLTKNISLLQDKGGYYPAGRDFVFARFFSVVMSAITVAIIFLIARKLTKSRRIALLSSAFLFVNPVFQSYARIISLEVPLLLFGSLFVLFSIKYANTKSLKNYLAVVASFTLLIGTRYNGVLLLPLFIGSLLFRETPKPKKGDSLKMVLMPVFSLLILIGIWPYLWHSTIINLLASADRGLEVHTREYFMGQLGNTPWFYYFVYFGVRTPLLLLATFVIGVFCRPKKEKLMLIALFLLPFLASVFPLKQDGLRYVNLYLIGFSIICALGVNFLLDLAKNKILKSSILVLIFGFCSLPLIRFFPYYLDYYNGLVSSNKIYNQRLFEIGGWGEGVLEAVKRLPKSQSSLVKKVYLAISPVHIIPDLPEGYKSTADFSQADFVLVNTNYRWYDNMVTSEDLENLKLINTVLVGNKFPLITTYIRSSMVLY
ncbi:MAG: phospholipid carrier-dependent glycosyltransferase [Patescibacteria group bacterium]